MIKKQHLVVLFLMLLSVVSYGQIGNEVQGKGSGFSLTSADYVTFYGDSSGHNHTSGLNTTYIGYKAGYSQTSESDNTFIGAYSGEFATTGTDNVFIGKYAGRYCDGTDNTVVGTEAGMAMTSGASDNTIMGEEAGQALIDGDDNVFIGEDAGYYTTGPNGASPSTLGGDNTFVGTTSGRSNTTGFANAFFGDEAGYDNTTGQWNTAVGDSALIDNGVGFNNTAIGHGAGFATEYADYNTFVGSYAGGDNNRNNSTSNANRNTYVGAFSGFSNRAGEDNVGMGTYSGYGGSYPLTGINGQWGGQGSSTNRSRTTFIGAQSAAKNNDVIAIGYKAQVDGRYGITLGNESRAQQTYAVAIGQGVTVNQANTMALGGDTAANRLSVGIGTVAANSNASLDLADVDKGLLINRVTTAERTTMTTTPASGVALTATDIGLLVYDTDVKGLFSWDGTQWVGLSSDNFGDHTATTDLEINNHFIDFGNTESAGIRFYNDTNNDFYKISMGNSANYHYGPVNNFSIKSTMNYISGRGWTWGVNDQAPIAAIDNTGKMQIANTMTIGEYTLPNTDGTVSQVLGTDGVGNVTWVDANLNTDAQDLDLSGNTLSLTNDTSTVDLSGYLDNTDAQAISLATNTLSITGTAATVDLSGYLDNTDAQDLSLSGTTLSLTNDGTTVDLSGLQDGTGTDAQAISLATNTLSITGNAGTVDLSAYVNTDTQNLTAATLTGSIIQIDIQNGSSVSVDISPLIADLENRVTTLEACACNVLPVSEFTMGKMNPLLQQNIPNPFNGTSTIGYYIPQSVYQAEIIFSNNVGQIVNRIAVNKKGEGEISVNASNYASGMYYYTLYLDGKKIDTKKMVVN